MGKLPSLKDIEIRKRLKKLKSSGSEYTPRNILLSSPPLSLPPPTPPSAPDLHRRHSASPPYPYFPDPLSDLHVDENDGGAAAAAADDDDDDDDDNDFF